MKNEIENKAWKRADGSITMEREITLGNERIPVYLTVNYSGLMRVALYVPVDDDLGSASAEEVSAAIMRQAKRRSDDENRDARAADVRKYGVPITVVFEYGHRQIIYFVRATRTQLISESGDRFRKSDNHYICSRPGGQRLTFCASDFQGISEYVGTVCDIVATRKARDMESGKLVQAPTGEL